MKSNTAVSWRVVLQLALAYTFSVCAIAQMSLQENLLQPDAVNRLASDKDMSVPRKLPYRPKDGDRLGYSKEENIKRLAPEIRVFLDGILRLYKEPGLFAKRREVFAVLGAEAGPMQSLNEELMPRKSPTDPFRQYMLPKGLFARKGWSGYYTYLGKEQEGTHWPPRPGPQWRATLNVNLTVDAECIDSRAVEGYLDLYLYANLDGKSHLIPSNLWDRHGASGGPYAKALSFVTPGISLGFLDGCLSHIILGNGFKYQELSDDDVFN